MSELMGLPEAAKRSGRNRMTLVRWIECGWLRSEEIRDGRAASGDRHLVTLDAIREAEQTARNAPKERVRDWLVLGTTRSEPSATPTHWRKRQQLAQWVRRNGRILL